MKKYTLALIALFTLFAAPVFAQDAAPAAEEVVFQKEWLSIATTTLLTVITLLFGMLGRYIQKRLRKWGLEEEAIDELSTQVTRLWHEQVRDLKEAAVDNKLTSREALKLRRLARKRTIDALKGPAKDFVVAKGKDWVSAKIEDIISAKKNKPQE